MNMNDALAKRKITINVLTVPEGYTFRIKYSIPGTSSSRNYKAGDRNEPLVYDTEREALDRAMEISKRFK
jgi:hypothetical protein